MRPCGSPEDLERRRTRAIDLLQRGYPPVEVAQRVGADRRSVRRWKAAYRARGIEGIARKPVPGRPSKLDKKSRKKLETLLLKGAQAAGFPTDLWTCPRVAEMIRSRLGVVYHVDHIGRLLHSFGWSPQKPARRAVERDEDSIGGWVKTEWPRIKKSLAPEGVARFYRREWRVDVAPGSPLVESTRRDAASLSA